MSIEEFKERALEGLKKEKGIGKWTEDEMWENINDEEYAGAIFDGYRSRSGIE